MIHDPIGRNNRGMLRNMAVCPESAQNNSGELANLWMEENLANNTVWNERHS